MQHFKKLVSVLMIVIIIISVALVGTVSTSASGTGIGLAEWALNAYNSGWSYVWGGSSPGAVDCSGLIYSYAGGYRNGFRHYSDYVGYVSNGIPNIHGLALETPSHVGVYVGNGMAVDARGAAYGVVYQSAYSRRWDTYCKVPGVSYPTTGWELFNGEYFYYENGEYITNTSREIGGVVYNFSSSGASDKSPYDMSATASSDTSSSENSADSSSSESSDDGVIRLGSTGENVTKLQNRLTELGYYDGGIDGSYGEKTQQAYIDFQTAAGVTIDGIPGPSDALILYSESAPYAPSDEDTAEDEPQESEPQESEPQESEPQDEEPVEPQAEETESEEITYKIGDYGDEVAKIQQRLKDLNYYSGEVNGAFDEATQEALAAFQKNNGLFGTGTADPFTMMVLELDNLAEAPAETEATEAETEDKTETTTALLTTGVSEASTEITSEIIMQTANFSAKALANLTSSAEITNLKAPSDNADFMRWFVVVLAIMGISFAIVISIDKIIESRARKIRKQRVALRREYRASDYKRIH